MGVKRITVRHKRADCIGCASCALIAPDNWVMSDEDGLATLKWAEWKWNEFMVWQVDEDQAEINKDAASACPVDIIYVSDSNQGI